MRRNRAQGSFDLSDAFAQTVQATDPLLRAQPEMLNREREINAEITSGSGGGARLRVTQELFSIRNHGGFPHRLYSKRRF
jgi:hypothetical protein